MGESLGLAPMANILAIAGSDPSGEAGLQTDLKTIRALGHRPLSVITAVTAQNDVRVYSVNPVETTIVSDQLRAVITHYPIGAVKVGLIATKQIAYQLYRIFSEEHLAHLVIDPVMQASSGATLLESVALPILTSFLIPLAEVVTPNLNEAEVLAEMPVSGKAQMIEAAKKIYQTCAGVKAVLIKGGHLPGSAVDILFDGDKICEFPSSKTYPVKVRGTGCILSSAIASFLAQGYELREAVWAAKAFLDRVAMGEEQEEHEQLSFIAS